MRQASKYDVDFWGLIICSYLTPIQWLGLVLAVLAIYPLYKSIKERNEQSETNLDNSERGEPSCTNGACEQPCKPKQRRNRTKAAEVPSQA